MNNDVNINTIADFKRAVFEESLEGHVRTKP